MRIQLSQADRERLDLPEWITFDEYAPTIGEMVLLEEQVGIMHDVWVDMLRGEPVPDKPDQLRRSMRTVHMMLWLAVRRAGKDVPYKGFDVSTRGLRMEDDEESVTEERKDQPDQDGSGSPDSPTTIPS